jgi:hypothetical protein
MEIDPSTDLGSAYHEAAHTVVAWAFKWEVHKVTITPESHAKGEAMITPRPDAPWQEHAAVALVGELASIRAGYQPENTDGALDRKRAEKAIIGALNSDPLLFRGSENHSDMAMDLRFSRAWSHAYDLAFRTLINFSDVLDRLALELLESHTIADPSKIIGDVLAARNPQP